MSNARTCPKCGAPLEPYAEVDIGVGTLQGGPWGCPRCHWVETDEALAETALPDIDLRDLGDSDGF